MGRQSRTLREEDNIYIDAGQGGSVSEGRSGSVGLRRVWD